MELRDNKYSHYDEQVSKIIISLERDGKSDEDLGKIQVSLDNLAGQYQDDNNLGSGRYKLYQAQAMLSYRAGDYKKSRQFINEAVNVRGRSYQLAERLLQHLPDEAITECKSQDSAIDKQPKYNGKLEGWLALFAVGLIGSFGLLLYDFGVNVPKLHELMGDMSFSMASDFQVYFVLAQIYDILAIVALMVLGFFFFKKAAITRALAIGILFASLIAQLILYGALSGIQSKYNLSSDSSSFNSLFVVGSLIWPFYWIFSRRVKATFVK